MPRRFTGPPAAWMLRGACAALVAVATSAGARQASPSEAKKPDAPSAQPAGASVAGRVTVPAGQKVPEMIVYLESTDPKYTFELPKAPLVVSQRDAKFDPGLLVVPVGTRVDFHNDETKAVAHNVFSNSEAKKFDLGLYKPGEKVEPVHFDTPGAVRLRCSIHRFMDGVVYVTPTPHHAVVDKDGQFTMAGVRPGAYRLKTWQRSKRYPDQDVPVSVVAGQPVPDLTVALSRK